ncbi:hypothetical protein [Corynebacterium matruchotii]|uniref:hypothetical protein n=1 Tax=Corynebacterium matruchotii TaxID=43768 RepID=UPI0028E37937|nr:hypothetical protein [Corynebacterium matruchotii]
MHTTTKIGTIVVISLLLGGCSFFGGDGSDAAASASASAAASPVFQAKEVPPITAAELDKPQTDPGLNVEITLQAAGYNPAGTGSVIYVLVKNLNEAALPTDALTVHLEGANPITEGTIGLDLPLGSGAAANLQYAFDAPTSALSNARFTIGNIIYQGDLTNV